MTNRSLCCGAGAFTTPSAIQCAQDQAKLLRDTARELEGK